MKRLNANTVAPIDHATHHATISTNPPIAFTRTSDSSEVQQRQRLSLLGGRARPRVDVPIRLAGTAGSHQAPRPDAKALKNFDVDLFAERHPTAVAAIAEYFQPSRTVDDLFRDCLEVVIAGAAVEAGTA